MVRRILLVSFFVLNALPLFAAKNLDPYKVLGVDKNASQRDIQKAFHKLSLQYHPDKNKAKGAQEKFSEINNAYELLSDEEKRKNYDLYGHDTPNPGFENSNFGGNQGGYSYFTSGGAGPGSNYFRSDPSGWQSMGGQGNSRTFSFSFGGGDPSGGSGFSDIFSNLFGGGSGSQSGGFGNFGGSNSNSRSATSAEIVDVTSQYYNKQIVDRGMTWLLIFFTPGSRQYFALETLVEDVAGSLDGALKAGKINCANEKSLCQKAGLTGSRSARLFVYSYASSDKGSLVEYTGEYNAKSLKTFCQEHLPRFSRRVDISQFVFPSNNVDNLPQVLLLSTKKDTPVMWRALSGLYRKRFLFYDAQVHDASDPIMKRLGVTNVPAVIGRTVDGKEHVIKAGISVRDLKSGIDELKSLLESFERKNKKVAASHKPKKQSQPDQPVAPVPLLSVSNFDNVCGEKIAVCVIGVFRSSKAKEMLEKILTEISQKTLVRRQSGSSVTYALLDANKQSAFLSSLDKSGYKSYDKLLVAYKPRRGKFATLTQNLTMEEAEKFVGSVLNGDVQFSNVRQKPALR
ncbi:dnaJ protein ERDJ3A [Carex littledalei]|uniref:DnaJ protein ERDJ3A n=1 Tax=Carex littledalei TaxID=544730 RepID=A0A833VLS9_9POAL|nr:dnaJ protein ERDJ3A [Carex littledalei]